MAGSPGTSGIDLESGIPAWMTATAAQMLRAVGLHFERLESREHVDCPTITIRNRGAECARGFQHGPDRDRPAARAGVPNCRHAQQHGPESQQRLETAVVEGSRQAKSRTEP